MRVRMKVHISGFRNGVEWPDKGAVIEIRDIEGADLIAAGYAEEAPDASTEFVAPDTFADPAGGAVYQPAEAAPDESEPVDDDPLAGVTLDDSRETEVAASEKKAPRSRKGS